MWQISILIGWGKTFWISCSLSGFGESLLCLHMLVNKKVKKVKYKLHLLCTYPSSHLYFHNVRKWRMDSFHKNRLIVNSVIVIKLNVVYAWRPIYICQFECYPKKSVMIMLIKLRFFPEKPPLKARNKSVYLEGDFYRTFMELKSSYYSSRYRIRDFLFGYQID